MGDSTDEEGPGQQGGKSGAVERVDEGKQELDFKKESEGKVKINRIEEEVGQVTSGQGTKVDRAVKERVESMGKQLEVNTLKPGKEATYVVNSGRKGRDSLTVVDVGIEGLPLAEAASRWGATIVGVVTPNQRGRLLATQWFRRAAVGSVQEVIQVLDRTKGDKHTLDMVMGAATTPDKITKFWNAVNRLQPAYSLLIVPKSITRKVAETRGKDYKILKRKQVCHAQVGGVTTTIWKLIVASHSRVSTTKEVCSRLNLDQTVPYTRSLKSILKPTNGLPYMTQAGKEPKQSSQEDPQQQPSSDGCIVVHQSQDRCVYDDRGKITLTGSNWVLTHSVFYPKQRIVRKMTLDECMEAWDYAIDMRRAGQFGEVSGQKVVRRVLQGPPGKIVRFGITTLLESLLEGKGTTWETEPKPTLAVLPRFNDEPNSLRSLNNKDELRTNRINKEEEDYGKAVKADNAKVNVELWDKQCSRILGLQGIVTVQLQIMTKLLRKSMFAWWRRNVTKECIRMLNQSGWDKRDVEAGRECVIRAAESTFWEWTDGSRLFFWRWPEEFRNDARDGIKFWHSQPSKSWFGRSTPADSQEAEERMRQKEDTLISRRYLEKGKGVFVQSVVPRFAVKKGDADIRVVWDARRNGVNERLWAPHFFLPGSENLEQLLTNGSFQGDMDVGEMFLNFMLHFSERKHFGVRYFTTDAEGNDTEQITRFRRLMFGSKCSPFAAIQMMYRALEQIVGDHKDPTNVFAWEKVLLNLPGDPKYNPALPRMSKITREGNIAPDSIFYVDDGRAVGFSEESCKRALRRMASVLNWLGIQDAARKRRPPMKQPGAWAGVVTDTSVINPTASLSEDKWIRLKADLEWLESASDDPKGIEYAKAASVRGFLIHAARVYPDFKPYLKALHLTMESWRPSKDENGWTKEDWVDQCGLLPKDSAEESAQQEVDSQNAPAYVFPVPLLKWSITVLKRLTKADKPIQRPIRASQGTTVAYGFGDASGDGYGSSILRGTTGCISVRHGVWCTKIAEESSNYREFRNLLDAIRIEAEADRLYGHELWMFTDNWVAEACFAKGSCHSQALNEMVADLHCLAMNHGFILHVVHVAGTRMIKQGTDPLSRGEFDAGVMGGDEMLKYIPLNVAANKRQQNLEEWILTWAESWEGSVLSPEEWHTQGHKDGTHVWMPPPAIALEVLQLMSMARTKRPYGSTHIVAIPRLMYNRWRKRLLKEADLIIEIPVGHQFWSLEQHEPLILAICCPVCSSFPFRLREKKEVVELQGALRRMREKSGLEIRDHLCKFWNQARRLVTL